MTTSSAVDLALEAIRDADLPHPGGDLLECFINEAADREQAATYLLKSSSGLAAFLADWVELIWAFTSENVDRVRDRSVVRDITKRDGAKCCISGSGGSLLDPLIVVRIFPETPKQLSPRLREMLGVCLPFSLRDFALTPETGDSPQNLWLVCKSAAAAFSQGYFQLMFKGTKDYFVTAHRIGCGPTPPPIIDNICNRGKGFFTDHSGSGIAVPSDSALRILSRFAKPIRWARVAKEIAQRSETPAKSTSPRLGFIWKPCATILRALWSYVPAALRMATYRRLASLGYYLYGPSCSLLVQRLPFGLYLKKKSHGGPDNEQRAVELVRQHTPIVVPRPLDLVSDGTMSYLLTSALPGCHIGLVIDTMSDEEIADFIRDLRRWLTQMRSIPKTVAPAFEITSAAGKGCFDYRITAGTEYDWDRGDFFGPFKDEDAFIEILRCGALPDVVHRGGHKIVFTHGDLNMRNIMVTDRKLSGIVDWENSGWYPEYWDYTKAHFVTRHHRRWKKIVDRVFAEIGDYQGELATEKELWEYCF